MKVKVFSFARSSDLFEGMSGAENPANRVLYSLSHVVRILPSQANGIIFCYVYTSDWGTHLFNPELVMFAAVGAVFIAAGFVDDIPGKEIFIGREQMNRVENLTI